MGIISPSTRGHGNTVTGISFRRCLDVNSERAIKISFPSAQADESRNRPDAADHLCDHRLIGPSCSITMSAFKTKNLYHLRISASSVLPLYVSGYGLF